MLDAPISGSHLRLTLSGSASSELSANIRLPTLKTEGSAPKGKSSRAPANARHRRFSASFVTRRRMGEDYLARLVPGGAAVVAGALANVVRVAGQGAFGRTERVHHPAGRGPERHTNRAESNRADHGANLRPTVDVPPARSIGRGPFRLPGVPCMRKTGKPLGAPVTSTARVRSPMATCCTTGDNPITRSPGSRIGQCAPLCRGRCALQSADPWPPPRPWKPITLL